jgi:hypothetical protein
MLQDIRQLENLRRNNTRLLSSLAFMLRCLDHHVIQNYKQLVMGTEMVLEMLSNFNQLSRLTVPQDFINFILREDFGSYSYYEYFKANSDTNYCIKILLLNYLIADVGQNSTLTETTSTSRNVKDNLLLGLSALSTYMPPKGTRVQTDSGHSKVRNSPQTFKVTFPPSHYFSVSSFPSLPLLISLSFRIFMVVVAHHDGGEGWSRRISFHECVLKCYMC